MRNSYRVFGLQLQYSTDNKAIGIQSFFIASPRST